MKRSNHTTNDLYWFGTKLLSSSYYTPLVSRLESSPHYVNKHQRRLRGRKGQLYESVNNGCDNEYGMYSDLEEGEIQPEGPSKEFLVQLKKVTGEFKMTHEVIQKIEVDKEKILRDLFKSGEKGDYMMEQLHNTMNAKEG
ncbi:hypothetical protein Tco_0335348 [Tanacetum coccineum]